MQDVLTQEQIDKLQYKWDVYLLTHFFEHKFYKTRRSIWIFCTRSNITEQQLMALKRVPMIMRGTGDNKYIWMFNNDIYGFVARHLTTLYRYIENKDISDVFDIANELKKSDINTHESKSDRSRAFFRKNKQKYEAARLSDSIQLETTGRGSKCNAAFYRAS